MSSHVNIENQYLNIVIPHRPNQFGTSSDAIYNRNNTSNVLESPYHYKLAISRFNIPCSTIPIFIFEPSKYFVRVRQVATDITSTNEVLYVNLDQNVNTGDEFYYVYSYNNFLTMINTALKASSATFGLSGPELHLDVVSQNLFIVVPEIFLDVDLKTSNFTIEFSHELLKFFDGFELIQLNENWHRFAVYGQYNNYIMTGSAPPLFSINHLIMKSEINVLTHWNIFSSFQITSNLPINNEFIETNFTGEGKPTSSENILADFLIQYNDYNSVARTSIDYNVDSYNWIDLTSQNEIRDIQFSVFWSDTTGKRRIHKLRKGENILIKLVFRDRTLVS
jgi:hypothetical protein